jgi:hypothetical protein
MERNEDDVPGEMQGGVPTSDDPEPRAGESRNPDASDEATGPGDLGAPTPDRTRRTPGAGEGLGSGATPKGTT